VTALPIDFNGKFVEGLLMSSAMGYRLFTRTRDGGVDSVQVRCTIWFGVLQAECPGGRTCGVEAGTIHSFNGNCWAACACNIRLYPGAQLRQVGLAPAI
jgi:hypothetical protein